MKYKTSSKAAYTSTSSTTASTSSTTTDTSPHSTSTTTSSTFTANYSFSTATSSSSTEYTILQDARDNSPSCSPKTIATESESELSVTEELSVNESFTDELCKDLKDIALDESEDEVYSLFPSQRKSKKLLNC